MYTDPIHLFHHAQDSAFSTVPEALGSGNAPKPEASRHKPSDRRDIERPIDVEATPESIQLKRDVIQTKKDLILMACFQLKHYNNTYVSVAKWYLREQPSKRWEDGLSTPLLAFSQSVLELLAAIFTKCLIFSFTRSKTSGFYESFECHIKRIERILRRGPSMTLIC